MKLSILIPVYNERALIHEVVARAQAVDLGGLEREIVVVDDASTDGTGDIVAAIPGIRCARHARNRGKGGAIKTAMQAATGDLFLIQDADLEYDPGDYLAMIQPILDGRCQLTLGVRIEPDDDMRRRKSLYWLSWAGNHMITWLTNVLYRNHAQEYEGCYKAFTRELIGSMSIRTNGFGFDNELVCKALKRGYATVDVPIRYQPRGYAQGKKIGWRDGFRMLWVIAKYRFVE